LDGTFSTVPGEKIVGYLVYPINGGMQRIVPSDLMLHLRGVEVDESGVGVSVVSLARQSMGLALAQEEYGARVFSNGANMSGIVKVPSAMNAETKKKTLEYFQSFSNISKAHGIGVMDDTMDFVRTSMSPSDVAFLDSRKLQVDEICRWFGVPPHMVAQLDRSTNNNIEHQGIEFVTHCLGPHLEDTEQEIQLQLLSETEGQRHFVRFNREELTMADSRTMADSDARDVQSAIKTPNEARKRRGLNPLPDGSKLMIQGAMVPVSMAGQHLAAKTKAAKEPVTT
jgi:HK97 family phage portal protein